MTLLTVNAGSTSVKLALFELDAIHKPVRTRIEQHSSSATPRAVLQALAESGSLELTAVAHRVVHGGNRFSAPTTLNAEVIAAIEELSALAPLHNPAAVRWIKAAAELWPTVPQVAAFDTALFRNLPRVAAEYALPAPFGIDAGVRRYGFHGLAHESMLQDWCALYPDLARGGRLITIHLGGGCSITAFDRGQPVDTSMGFSPLEGLVMETRSGDIDPAVVPYLQRKLGISSDQIIQKLNEDCGLAGISGSDGNPSVLIGDPSPQAQFAVDLYCYRIRKFVGGYLAVLGGCDGIVFGGGVGEHVPGVRSRALEGMEWAGVRLDPTLNSFADGGCALISSPDSPVKVHVAVVDEESALARAVVRCVAGEIIGGK
jgi:acetate kinase